MQQPINIIFCRHEGNARTFLFKVLSNCVVMKSSELFVDTVHGEARATAVSNSFFVSPEQLDEIVAGTGAYYPLKEVTGYAQPIREVTRYEKMPLQQALQEGELSVRF